MQCERLPQTVDAQSREVAMAGDRRGARHLDVRWVSGEDGVGLRREADVAMMQATDFRNLHDSARVGEFDWPDIRRILVEREMRARPVIVGEVTDEGAAEMPFAQDQNVVQTLGSDGADEPFREGVLPWALRSGEDFTDSHALHALLKYVAVNAVAIANEIRWCAIIRESVNDLLGGPVGGGVLGHVEVDDASAVMGEHDQDEEQAEVHG